MCINVILKERYSQSNEILTSRDLANIFLNTIVGQFADKLVAFGSGMATFSSLAIFQTITKDTAVTGNIGNIQSENYKDVVGVCANGTVP